MGAAARAGREQGESKTTCASIESRIEGHSVDDRNPA